MMAIVDYLIITPLDEKFEYVCKTLELITSMTMDSIVIGADVYRKTTIPTENGEVLAVILSIGRMGDAAVQSAVEAAIGTWRPATVVLVGIAGSLDADKVNLGSVIVPRKVFGYTEAKADETGIHYRSTGYTLTCELSALARAVSLDFKKAWQRESRQAGMSDATLAQRLSRQDGDSEPKLHIDENDCLASGNTVVASTAEVNALRNVFMGDIGKTLKAVEMEAKGLCEALCKVRSAPPALIIRGISDFADENKAKLEKKFKTSWRRYAAQNAMRFLLLIIRNRQRIVEEYIPVKAPTYNMVCHRDAGRLGLGVGLKAREEGMKCVVFSPLLYMTDGLPKTDIIFRARCADGSQIPFLHFVLRTIGSQAVWRPTESNGHIKYTLPRTHEAVNIEVFIGLPPEAAQVELVAVDEFNAQQLSYGSRMEYMIMGCKVKLFEQSGAMPTSHAILTSHSVEIIAINQSNRSNLCNVHRNGPLSCGNYGADTLFAVAAFVYEIAISDISLIYAGTTVPNLNGDAPGDVDLVLYKLPAVTSGGSAAVAARAFSGATTAIQVHAGILNHPIWTIEQKQAVLCVTRALTSLRGATTVPIANFIDRYERSLRRYDIDPSLF